MRYHLYLIGFLFFFFNIPETVALKNTLGFLVLCSSVFAFYRQKNLIIDNFLFEYSRNIFFILILLSLYIFIHLIFFAWEPIWSLSDYKSHWFYPVIYFFSGAVIVFYFSKIDNFGKKLISFIFIFLTIHIAYAVVQFLIDSFNSGVLQFRVGGHIGAELTSYIANIVQAFLLGELIYRSKKKENYMFFDSKIIIFIFLLTTLAIFFTAVRFSTLIYLFLLLLSVFIFLFLNKVSNFKNNLYIFSLTLSLISLILYGSFSYDKRWSSLIETISIATDTKNNKAWLDKDLYSLPKLSNGEDVSRSNYERIAWAYQGLKYIYAHPMGIGYGRNIFGHAIENEYRYLLGDEAKKVRGKHSHSGIIDFTIGVGLLGAILWFVFIFLLLKFLFLNLKRDISAPSIIGILITTSFLARSFVDSFMRDHMFQQFMLLMGILVALSIFEKKGETNYAPSDSFK